MVNYLFLCGGFGTRLERDLKASEYSHLVGTNKGLLKLGNKPLLSHWIEQINTTPYLITNQKHYKQFIDWGEIPTDHIYCNSVLNNETRNGAVQDLKLAIDHFKLDTDNLIVIAGDTLLKNFHLDEFLSKCLNLGKPVILNYLISDQECLKSGVLETGSKDSLGFVKVTNFLEKPSPESTESRLGSPCFYFLNPDSMSTLSPFLREYREKGLSEIDAAGKWIAYLVRNRDVYSLEIDGRLDIGGLETYLEAQRASQPNAVEVDISDAEANRNTDASGPLVNIEAEDQEPLVRPLSVESAPVIQSFEPIATTPFLNINDLRSLCYSLYGTIPVLFGIILFQRDVYNSCSIHMNGISKNTFTRTCLGIYCIIGGILFINNESSTEYDEEINLLKLASVLVANFIIVFTDWNDFPDPSKTYYDYFVIASVSLTTILVATANLIQIYKGYRFEFSYYDPSEDTPEPVLAGLPSDPLELVIEANSGVIHNGRLVQIDKTAIIEDCEGEIESESSAASPVEFNRTSTNFWEDLRSVFLKHFGILLDIHSLNNDVCLQILLVLSDIWTLITPLFRFISISSSCQNSNTWASFVPDYPINFCVNTILVVLGILLLFNDLVKVNSFQITLPQRSFIFTAIAILHLSFNYNTIHYVEIERVDFILAAIFGYLGSKSKKNTFRPIWKLDIIQVGAISLTE